jgi:N-acetylmuramic acid 6-phosphate etherase
MLVVGLALEYGRDWARARSELAAWIAFLEKDRVPALGEFIVSEADTYARGEFTYYTAEDMAITVFTDTTERAPTFNLAAFDNPVFDSDKHSLTYLSIPSAATPLDSWRKLLARDPRPLEWPEVHSKTSSEYLLTFDFGQGAVGFRRKLLPLGNHHEFSILSSGRSLEFGFRNVRRTFELSGQNALFDQLTAKMLLNMHSTLVFGRLGRFEGNLMTWVYPSNGKLVDRAARYTQILLKNRGLDFDYDSIVRAQFACKEELSPKESIVHKTIEKLTGGFK